MTKDLELYNLGKIIILTGLLAFAFTPYVVPLGLIVAVAMVQLHFFPVPGPSY